MKDLEKYRHSIIEGIRKLREERRFTQAEFAKLLDLSQQQYSKIERGEGSISAEQFLQLLDKFALPLSYFVETKPKNKGEDLVLQNALVRLGAAHLREAQGVFIPEKLTNPGEVIFETLDVYQSSRLITALAPIIVKNIQRINFNVIEKKLREFGHENRLWWVLENTLKSLQHRLKEPFLPRDVKLRYRRAETFLVGNVFLKQLAEGKGHALRQGQPVDIFDEGITTQKTLESLRLKNNEISNKWNIVTRIQQNDFEEALRSTESS